MLGIADRQLLPDHRVDQREERRIGADADREREHRCQGEAGGFRERPDRVADVLPGLLEPGPPPLGAGVFGGEREVAELARVGHGGDRPQLFLHVALGRAAPPGQEIPEPSEEHHESASPAAGLSTPATARTKSAHSVVSCRRRLRPDGVSR